MAKCNFTSDFIPMPQTKFEVLPINEGYKVKIYTSSDEIESIRAEFETLYNQKYTHVMNMPGDFNQILCTAKHYKIICLDRRLVKHVSEFCSRRQLLCSADEELNAIQ
ncbi:GrBNV gp62-like protein [Tomelloso virus]|uniref:GrBNV gp62-like protein n=1 Tax=Tomelloso virus TaxID=2053981 RepID=A0A2H4T2W4_9VIRU|nr:GrBNV gp62-like protein [Tomelloso virus]ATY70262.1 GrBNV gp62-like protein [Tomelloso virus]